MAAIDKIYINSIEQYRDYKNRLKEQYGEEYDQILNHTSMYDTYTVQPSSKFKILKNQTLIIELMSIGV